MGSPPKAGFVTYTLVRTIRWDPIGAEEKKGESWASGPTIISDTLTNKRTHRHTHTDSASVCSSSVCAVCSVCVSSCVGRPRYLTGGLSFQRTSATKLLPPRDPPWCHAFLLVPDNNDHCMNMQRRSRDPAWQVEGGKQKPKSPAFELAGYSLFLHRNTFVVLLLVSGVKLMLRRKSWSVTTHLVLVHHSLHTFTSTSLFFGCLVIYRPFSFCLFLCLNLLSFKHGMIHITTRLLYRCYKKLIPAILYNIIYY